MQNKISKYSNLESFHNEKIQAAPKGHKKSSPNWGQFYAKEPALEHGFNTASVN